mmetsp:Transcript_13298/g.21826  ORF Transcript_13298/g.21826 Transcript_13298/m.21826 type:complete len:150 (+) Transcript_13298:78-527(+)
MGAIHSTPSFSSATASCESNDGSSGPSYEPDSKIPSGAASSVPPAPMPVLSRPETFEEKLYRKFKAEPLVPIGCLTTAYFLGSGIKSFYNRDPVKSQSMMRLRVASQFATLMIFIGYAGMNAFTFELAPGMAVPSEQGYGGKSGGDKEE